MAILLFMDALGANTAFASFFCLKTPLRELTPVNAALKI
jgi:hypothetical protein